MTNPAKPGVMLGLDLGLKTGYAYVIGGACPVSGVWSNEPRKMTRDGARFLNLDRRLEWLRGDFGRIDFVVYEDVRFSKYVTAAQHWAAYRTVVQLFCERHAIPYEGVPVTTLKKFATGTGRADKPAMIRAFVRDTMRTPADDNEADAYHALRWGLEMTRQGRRIGGGS